MLARCATAVRETVNLIKTLITVAQVVGFDETTLRVGPAGLKRYVLSAVTECYSVFHLGGRDLDSFRDFAILWPGRECLRLRVACGNLAAASGLRYGGMVM